MKNNKEIKQNRTFTYDVIWQTLIFGTLAISCINNNNNLLLILVGVSSIYCLFAPIDSVFCFAMGITIYDYSFNINGVNATFIIALILVFKILNKNWHSFKISTDIFISAMIILTCELVGDLFYESVGEVILTLCNVILFITVLAMSMLIRLDIKKTIVLFSIATLTALWTMVASYGNLLAFFDLLFHSIGLYRFGIGNANQQGGAMALPLYALLLLSMSITMFLTKNKENKFYIAYVCAANVVVIFFTIMTISRSFYFGLIGIIFGLIIGIDKKRQNRLFKIFLISLVSFSAMYTLFSDEIIKAFMLLVNRVKDDSSGAGRLQVWFNGLGYLFTHPISLLIGEGACTYPTIKGAGMSAGMHNLFLDILLSWGLFGFGALFIMVSRAIKNIKSECGRIDRAPWLPIYALLFFSLTALRCNSMRTCMFWLACIMIIKSTAKKENNDDT